MATDAAGKAQRRWSSTNSRQIMKAYDHSPVHSPPTTPPTLSRNNSVTSINSTQSEPAWHPTRHASAPDVHSGDLAELRGRKLSHTVQTSTANEASRKKSGFKALFSRHKDPEKDKLKELKRKEKERAVLTSQHAALIRAKMLTDPQYREFQQRHKKPNVKTAGIKGDPASGGNSAAALQEMRYPHSGPPAVHRTGHNIPLLTRIESHDEPDTEVDRWEKTRQEWNDAKEHNMVDIPEARSRHSSPRASPWVSPIASREPSPNRLGTRPGLGNKRHSYAGGYTKDAHSGRWTRKTPPNMTPTSISDIALNPDTLAASLAERLNTSV